MELSVGFKDSLNHLVLTCSEDKDFLKQDVKLEVEEHTLENKYTEEPLLAESYTENITNITLENHSVKDETSKTSYIIAIQNVKVEIKEELEESNVNHSQNKFKKTNIKKLETNSSNEVNRNKFIIWKRSMEETSCSFYVVSKYKQDKNITYFNCNRSKTSHDGKQVLNKQYKRNCKSQGLCHMDSLCTSQIKIVSANDKITVNFQKTHYGHEIELGKIRLPKQEREKIASKLLVGIPPKKIVQSVYDNIGEHLKRIDYKIIHGFIDRPNLLSQINFNVHHQALRYHNVFNIPFHRTTYGIHNSLDRYMGLLNDRDFDTFNITLTQLNFILVILCFILVCKIFSLIF
ncbi:uncharacterized protein [Diabrotica undecimpunctata]|uniref:uncharacterized protein isoform X3 n=1 Tax=Diabrotica undecimpunctata TaxID=50387 RepID=UPI003B635565